MNRSYLAITGSILLAASWMLHAAGEKFDLKNLFTGQAAFIDGRSLKPGNSSEAESFNSPKSTQASRTGKWAQTFGPRNARTFRISMPLHSPSGALAMFVTIGP